MGITRAAVALSASMRLARALDQTLAIVVVVATLPLWPLLGLLAWRDPLATRVSIGPAESGAWRVSGAWVPDWLGALPLWLAAARGRFAIIGGGAWRDGREVVAPLLPGLVSLTEVRGLNGVARADRLTLDRELAGAWGLGAWLRIAARAVPVLALPPRVGGRPSGRVLVHGLALENAALRELVHTLGRCAAAHVPLWATFVNADCVNIARRDADYAACLRRCDVALPDGIGVRLAARWSGQVMGENLVGTDLLPALCRASAEPGGPGLFFLGGAPGVAEAAADNLRRDLPGVRIVGTAHGYFARGTTEEDAVLAAIARSGADVLLVGFGAPLQEKWIARVRPRLPAPVVLGVGGLFDYFSGRVPRAPAWMRELGLEWAFRLRQEPRRLWRRYVLGNPRFLCATASDLLRPLGRPASRAA